MNKKLMEILKILPVDILRASEGYINKTVDEVYTQAHDQIMELFSKSNNLPIGCIDGQKKESIST